MTTWCVSAVSTSMRIVMSLTRPPQTQTQTVTKHLAAVGLIPDKTLYYYLDHGGQHSEMYWGRRFWVPMVSLYPPIVK